MNKLLKDNDDCEFSRGVGNKLKHFIYALIDPRSNMPFYIGKGQNGRPFAHLKKNHSQTGPKRKMLNTIKRSGLKPSVVVIAHGLEKAEDAERIEAVLIATLKECGIYLVNKVGGKECGQIYLSESEINARLGAVPTTIREPSILVKLTKTLAGNESPEQLMSITCGAWLLRNPCKPQSKAHSKKYILGAYDGVIRSAYTIDHSTWRMERVYTKNGKKYTRWRCEGKPPPPNIKRYIDHADVSKYVGQKEFRFLPAKAIRIST